MTKNRNKKIGNGFEAEFCQILFDKGFWAHNMAQKANGQPADVIAAKDGTSYLIDCKVCSDGVFDISRMEKNQHSSMELWEMCGNGTGWFAILIEGEIFMVSHKALVYTGGYKHSLRKSDIDAIGSPLERWVELRI